MRTTDTDARPTEQQYVVEYVPPDALPGAAWTMARTDEATYLFIRAGDVTPEVLEEAWAAFRWMALHRPHEHPQVPRVIPMQRDSNLSLRDAVIRGHAG